MAINITVRPTTSGLQVSTERPSGAPVRGAVATELSPTQSVSAVASADAIRQDPSHAAKPGALRDLVLDAQSREVIYREVDKRSRRVARRVSEIAARRLKAYSRSADDAENNHGRQADTEL